MREATARSTKHPPSFGIDWLIDDSEGVRLEAAQHGFSMLVVQPEDAHWVLKSNYHARASPTNLG
ncbi:hypothetical protein BXP70_05805 [Hymenobacter crusticola]|uniref:Uncharacterized protein n=1 Tax=Hymenobacter crusticola TaxID=1770526 RepID=A0A243WIY4_9BACT|nr:hypothetical protein BXP70_05805 [Hymenobacter crusticola]